MAVATPGRRLVRERGTCDSYSPSPTLQQIDTWIHLSSLTLRHSPCPGSGVTLHPSLSPSALITASTNDDDPMQ